MLIVRGDWDLLMQHIVQRANGRTYCILLTRSVLTGRYHVDVSEAFNEDGMPYPYLSDGVLRIACNDIPLELPLFSGCMLRQVGKSQAFDDLDEAIDRYQREVTARLPEC